MNNSSTLPTKYTLPNWYQRRFIDTNNDTYKYEDMEHDEREAFISSVKNNLIYKMDKYNKNKQDYTFNELEDNHLITSFCPIQVIRFPDFILDSNTYCFKIKASKPKNNDKVRYTLMCESMTSCKSTYNTFIEDFNIDVVISYLIDTTFEYNKILNAVIDVNQDNYFKIMSPTNNSCCVCYDKISETLYTICNHGLCSQCCSKMKKNECPICKKVLDDSDDY